MFWFFNKNIDTDLLRLSQIVYGGELYLGLNKYSLCDIDVENTRFQKVTDTLLLQKGNSDFYSYKNTDSGFVCNVFKNRKNGDLILAFRGTERIGLGENTSDIGALIKDVITDSKFITCEIDGQFEDAYEFYKLVRNQNKKSKITIIGQSLGGGLAQLTGAKVYSDTGEKVKTYSYNAPGCRHLLEVFGCKTKEKYSFITNYAVMNDWCGMFGENVGKTYLIPPIELSVITSNNMTDIMNNVLLKTHEGIFEYSGRVYDKPEGFNQQEGLSLWYFDKNNPLKEMGSISDNIDALMSKLPSLDDIGQSVMDMTSDFINEQKAKLENIDIPQNVRVPLLMVAESIATLQTEQRQRVAESIKNRTLSKFWEYTISELTPETLESANRVLKKMKLV